MAAINKLSEAVRIPLKYTKGSVAHRQNMANAAVDDFYKLFEQEIKDDYTIFSFENISDKIKKVLPENKLYIEIKNKRSRNYEAYTEYLYNKKNNNAIEGVSINLTAIGRSIRTVHIPELMHEFQHITDQIFHPKYLARAQSLSRKKILKTNNYNKFYDKYYYCVEDFKSEKNKKDILENVKIRTINFIKKLGINEKLDILQDIRYSLESEVQAYAKEKAYAQKLKDMGLSYKKDSLYDMPKHTLFREKIEVVNEILSDVIKTERKAHSQRLELNRGKA